ncbi:MAG: hypothetical protein ABWX67_07230 [Allosphingosinicella sp.]
MRSQRLFIAAATLATVVTTLVCAGQVQAKPIPTARNDWRLKCSNGTVIAHFYGTYGQALNSTACAPGYIVGIWDNGLVAFGHTPRFGRIAGPATADPAGTAEAESRPRR